jgi:hypothetical protein
MSERSFQLHFAGRSTAELCETRFYAGPGAPARVTVRGKTSGAYGNAGSFHFSSAVRALCVLCTKSAIAGKSSCRDAAPIILGTQGSLAASLDYALTKQPVWLCEMFGSDISGKPLAQRLFRRSNSHRKRPGPVVLSVNEKAIPLSNIHIFWNENEIDSLEALQTLLSLLAATEEPEKPKAPSLEKLAA